MKAILEDQPMFTIEASLEATVILGCTPHGERRFVAITGGIVKGRKLSGRIMPGGADWQIVRSNGTAEIHARYMIETERGARVLVDSQGLRRGPADVLDRLARGEDVDPGLYYFRTVMRFEAADPALEWLNGILALACGKREAHSVRLEVFEVT